MPTDAYGRTRGAGLRYGRIQTPKVPNFGTNRNVGEQFLRQQKSQEDKYIRGLNAQKPLELPFLRENGSYLNTSPYAPATPPPMPQVGDWQAGLNDSERYILSHESSFSPTAKNPTSTAFGIWQGLQSTRDTYGRKLGFDPNTTDPWQQLAMFRAYVKDRYGTPEAAADFWRKHKWY